MHINFCVTYKGYIFISHDQSAGDAAVHIATLRNHPEVVRVLASFRTNLDVENKVTS